MAELFLWSSLLALLTLTLLEIVLGIDNLVFLAIIAGKLPEEEQPRATKLGLILAAVGRIVLLLGIAWLLKLDKSPLFTLPFDMPGVGHHAESTYKLGTQAMKGGLEEHTPHGTPITIKDLILLGGGAFLLGKATWEIGHALEGHKDEGDQKKAGATFGAVLTQIFFVNLVFSIDSVLTAIGMVPPAEYETVWVPYAIMITAVVLSIVVMLIFAEPVVNFVNKHPSVKMLALAFLILIGVVLAAESMGFHIPRGYIYTPMAFSLFVEILNLKARSARKRAKHI